MLAPPAPSSDSAAPKRPISMPWVLWGVLSTNIFVGALIILVLQQSYLRHREESLHTVENDSKILEEALGGFIRTIDQTILNINNTIIHYKSYSSTDTSFIPESIHALHSLFPDALWINVVNAQGDEEYRSDSLRPRRRNISDRTYFLRAKNDPGSGLIVSNLVEDEAYGVQSVIFCRRLSGKDGGFAGLIEVAIPQERLLRLLAKPDLGPGMAALLVNDGLRYLARYPVIPGLEKKLSTVPLAPRLIELIKSGEEAAPYEARPPIDGVKRMFFYRSISGQPLYLAVGMAEDDYLRPWRHETAVMTLLMLAFTIATSFLAWHGYRGWARWLDSVAALRKTTETLEKAQRMSHIGSWGLDIASGRCSWSDEHYRIFGVSPDSFVPAYDAFFDLLDPADRGRVAAIVDAAIAGDSPFSVDYRILRPDGRHRDIHGEGELVRAADGRPLELIGTAQDVTERVALKRLENEVIERRAELARVLRMATLGEFAVTLAHEVNQPLASISAYADRLKQIAASPELDRKDLTLCLTRIARDALRASGIVKRVRSMVGRNRTPPQRVDVNALIRDLEDVFRSEAEKAAAAVKLELAPDLKPILGDPVQLQQLFMNLALNAFDAMSNLERPRILTITTAMTKGDLVQIRVVDTGAGIPQSISGAVFDSFFTTKESGLGMGLSICKTIVEAHLGRLEIARSDSTGSEFVVTLPAGPLEDDRFV